MIAALPHPLPHALTRLVGRDSEITAIVEVLQRAESRLITITGAGGVGKSRVAIAAAGLAATVLPGDVGFIDLSVLDDPGLLPATIAGAFGLPLSTEPGSLYALQSALRDRPFLVLLDGFDRLIPAAAVLAELLRGCPSLTVLVTSRARLQVRGERVFLLRPLPVPTLESAAALDVVSANPAVALFLDRARDIRPGFALSPETAGIVVQIVQHLDGLPLALELAAARLDLLSPMALLDHLQRRAPLLAGSDQDLPERLRTMHAAIAWSYDLLSPEEQHWVQTVAVFAGGCSLSGVSAVSGVTNEFIVLDALRSLTTRSWLWHDDIHQEPGRFRMLQMVREFALSHLAATGDERQVRQRHATWALALAEQAVASRETGPVDITALDALASEYANLQAALGWLEEHGPADHFVRLAAALSWFWLYRRSRSEGRRWLASAIDQAAASGVRNRALARALDGAGVLALTQGDYAAAESSIADCLAVNQDLGDSWGVPAALNLLGVVARAREDFPFARKCCREALTLFQAQGDTAWSALALLNLGTIAFWTGQIEEAETQTLAGLTLYRQIQDSYGIAVGLNDLARFAADRGEVDRAAALFVESQHYWQRIGTPEGVVDWVARVATLTADQGQYERAIRLFSVVDRECAVLGYAFEPPERKRQRRSLDAARLALDENDVATAWAEGMTLPLAAALVDANSVLEDVASAPAAQGDRLPVNAGLTPRELEVVRLLAEGRSDRQIGESLFISHRTVMSHVKHIMDKLDVESRTAAATAAVRRQLI